MSEVTLRAATGDDVEAIGSLVAALPEWFNKGVPEEVRGDCARFPGLVAESGGAVVGFLLWHREDHAYSIKWLGVTKERHRQGLGSRLVDELVRMAREAGAKRVCVETLAPTHDYEPYARTRAFYEARGFRLEAIEAKGFEEEGLDKATYLLELREEGAMTRPDLNRYEDAWTAEVYDYEEADGWGERDVAFYLSLAAEFPGPTLELACGTGRVTLPLARSGVEVTGLDISENMLRVARRKLSAEPSEAQARVKLVQGDMTAFDLGRQFALIVIPFRAFQALLTRDEHRGCLRCCREHLLPEGRLAINVFNPRLSRIVAGALPEGPEEFVGPDGSRVTWSAVITFDLRDQRLHGEWRYECLSPAGEKTVREHVLEMHYFFRFEMEWMFEACGLEVESLYGDFARTPFAGDSDEMVFVVRRIP